MQRLRILTLLPIAASLCAFAPLAAHAAEHVTLRNGFDFLCDHRTTDGDRTRLFLLENAGNAPDAGFVEVPTADIATVETVDLPQPEKKLAPALLKTPPSARDAQLTRAELHELLTAAGSARNLDVDLLDIVVHAESGGRVRAVSRTGAQGLMQLMPGTAADLGVTDSFQPDQNINGGTAYLNALLIRYHDHLALALAAYNAGPAAVDKYHGVPPYRETRAYVARIIHQFNQRKLAAQAAAQAENRAAERDRERAALKPASAGQTSTLE